MTRHCVLAFALATLAASAAADTITLTNGRVIQADRTWVQGEQLLYEKNGGTYGLPRSIVLKLHREINRSLESPDVKARLDALGILPFTLPTPEAFGDYIKSEIAKYAKVVKDSGARPD